MARREIVETTCDLPHDEEVEAVDTVVLGLDGQRREIDVCGPHLDELNDAVGPFLSVGRPLPSRVAGGRTPTWPGVAKQRPRRDVATSVVQLPVAHDPQAMREWAKEQGMQVSDRGRVSKAVQEAYASAMSKPGKRSSA